MRYEDEPADWQPDFTPDNLGPVRAVAVALLVMLCLGCAMGGYLVGANL